MATGNDQSMNDATVYILAAGLPFLIAAVLAVALNLLTRGRPNGN
jgi:hypothetical protein